MDAQELKEIQSPLKARYREDPDTAMITLEAEGRLGSEEVSCSVATGRAMVEAGLHPASGATAASPVLETCCSRHWWLVPV